MERISDTLGNSTARKVILSFLLMGIGLLVVTYSPVRESLLRLAIAPSFEGPHTDVFCVQPSATSNCYTANNAATGFNWVVSTSGSGPIGNTPYSWQFTSQQVALTKCNPTSSLYQGLLNYNSCDKYVSAQITSNNPFTQSGPVSSSACSTDPNAPEGCWAIINYWTRNPYNASQWFKVYGYIVLYYYQLTVSVQPGSDPDTQFKGDTIWFRTYSPTFDNYAFNPQASNEYANGTQIGAWSAPLVMVLQNGKDAVVQQSGGYATNDNTIPDWHQTNAPQVLYSTPQVTTAISTVPLGSANQSLAFGGNSYSPDTRLSQYAYYPLILSSLGSFGYNCGILGCSSTGYPAINLNFQVWFIQLGRYLFTNPVHHPLVTTANTPTQTSVGALMGFLTNPLTLFAGLAAGSVIAVIALILLVGGPLVAILTLVTVLRRKEV